MIHDARCMIEDSSGFLEDSRALEERSPLVFPATLGNGVRQRQTLLPCCHTDDQQGTLVEIATASSNAFLPEGMPLETSTADFFRIHPASCILHHASYFALFHCSGVYV